MTDASDQPTIDSRLFRDVLGHFPTGVTAVTAMIDGRPVGMAIAEVSWRPGPTGAPIIDGSIAYIDCTIEAVHDGGDHDIVVGRVVELEILDAKDPLLFWKGGYGTFA